MNCVNLLGRGHSCPCVRFPLGETDRSGIFGPEVNFNFARSSSCPKQYHFTKYNSVSHILIEISSYHTYHTYISDRCLKYLTFILHFADDYTSVSLPHVFIGHSGFFPSGYLVHVYACFPLGCLSLIGLKGLCMNVLQKYSVVYSHCKYHLTICAFQFIYGVFFSAYISNLMQ